MSDPQASFLAIFSDIHGNIDALSAVLADIDQFPVRGMFCLGDIVGYGSEPASCVQRLGVFFETRIRKQRSQNFEKNLASKS